MCFVTCTVDLVGQGSMTRISTISISESTEQVTELILISLNLSTLKHGKQKKINFPAPLMTEIEMVNVVAKRPGVSFQLFLGGQHFFNF